MKSEVIGTVVCLIPEFHQMKVRDANGNLYSPVEGHTADFQVSSYKENQHVKMEVEWVGSSAKVNRIELLP
jgi:hypothetical protein